MTEPLYTYRKGQGWVISTSKILTPEECAGEWIKHPAAHPSYKYPVICRDWEIIPRCQQFEIGDVVPWDGNYIEILTEITVSRISGRTDFKVIRVTPNGQYEEDTNYVGSFGYSDVARRT